MSRSEVFLQSMWKNDDILKIVAAIENIDRATNDIEKIQKEKKL